MIFLIGGNGFVGAAYARLFERKGFDYRLLTRDTIESYRGKACDVLVNANGNSRKYMADREPLWEFDASTRSVAQSVEWFKPGLYVHLSTGDVYPDQSRPEVTREDQEIDVGAISRYGLHKHLAEQIVRGTQKKYLVFRMGGFVGPGLKKNAIFDMQHDHPLWLAPDSELQFISTDSAAEIVWSIATSGAANETLNLGARGLVRIGDLHGKIGSKSQYKPEARSVRFELSLDRLAATYGGELPDTEREVLHYLGQERGFTLERSGPAGADHGMHLEKGSSRK